MVRTGRPKAENPKNRKLVIKMDDGLFEDFSEKCKKTNSNKSELIRKWIVEFLNDER